MPFMSGVVGWATNVLALKMTFLPIEYIGVNWWRMEGEPWGLFGWQGIIPTKAAKMASITAKLMTERLFDISEIFGRLEPEKFYLSMEDGLLIMIDEILTDVGKRYMPTTWSYMPDRSVHEYRYFCMVEEILTSTSVLHVKATTFCFDSFRYF